MPIKILYKNMKFLVVGNRKVQHELRDFLNFVFKLRIQLIDCRLSVIVKRIEVLII